MKNCFPGRKPLGEEFSFETVAFYASVLGFIKLEFNLYDVKTALPALKHQTICRAEIVPPCRRFKVADKMRQRSTSCILITWQPTNYGFLLAFSFFASLLSFRNANKTRDCLNFMDSRSSYCKWNLRTEFCSLFHGHNYSWQFFSPLWTVSLTPSTMCSMNRFYGQILIGCIASKATKYCHITQLKRTHDRAQKAWPLSPSFSSFCFVCYWLQEI